jgi:hypothetical protein
MIGGRNAEPRATIDELAAPRSISATWQILWSRKASARSPGDGWDHLVASVEEQLRNARCDVIPAGAVKPANETEEVSDAPSAAAPVQTAEEGQLIQRSDFPGALVLREASSGVGEVGGRCGYIEPSNSHRPADQRRFDIATAPFRVIGMVAEFTSSDVQMRRATRLRFRPRGCRQRALCACPWAAPALPSYPLRSGARVLN